MGTLGQETSLQEEQAIQPEDLPNTDTTLTTRGEYYGNFADNAQITDNLFNVLQASQNWYRTPPFMRVALMNIAIKLGRMLSGDWQYTDNAHDVGGYARLIEEGIEEYKENEQRTASVYSRSTVQSESDDTSF